MDRQVLFLFSRQAKRRCRHFDNLRKKNAIKHSVIGIRSIFSNSFLQIIFAIFIAIVSWHLSENFQIKQQRIERETAIYRQLLSQAATIVALKYPLAESDYDTDYPQNDKEIQELWVAFETAYWGSSAALEQTSSVEACLSQLRTFLMLELQQYSASKMDRDRSRKSLQKRIAITGREIARSRNGGSNTKGVCPDY